MRARTGIRAGRGTILVRRCAWVAIGVLLFSGVSHGSLMGQGAVEGPRPEPTVIWKVTVSDGDLIHRILADQKKFVEDEESIESIDIYDLQNNGFGEKDVAFLNPQHDLLPFTQIGEDLANEMSQWPLVENREVVVGISNVALQSYEDSESPELGIFAGALSGIDRFYHDLPISMTLERDSTTVHFRMWGYTADSLRYSPGGGFGTGQSGFDVYHVLQADTMTVADTTMYDVITVYRTYGDTVYIPGAPPGPAVGGAGVAVGQQVRP